MATRFDLASLADVKTWLDVAGEDDDALIAQLITQISRAILNVLDRSTILPTEHTDTYDGGNGSSILLRQWPVNAILSCSVNGIEIPPSLAFIGTSSSLPGYVLDPSDDAPPGRMQRLSLRGLAFSPGLQNVTISYAAGYQIKSESAVVPEIAPFTVSVFAPYGDWASDAGVTYANGVPLMPVAANPLLGQYVVGSGNYIFSAADTGTAISLNYGYVPADLAVCCMDWVAERYAYRSRIGQQSKSLGGQETMAFIVKDIPDFVANILQPYRRVVTP